MFLFVCLAGKMRLHALILALPALSMALYSSDELYEANLKATLAKLRRRRLGRLRARDGTCPSPSASVKEVLATTSNVGCPTISAYTLFNKVRRALLTLSDLSSQWATVRTIISYAERARCSSPGRPAAIKAASIRCTATTVRTARY